MRGQQARIKALEKQIKAIKTGTSVKNINPMNELKSFMGKYGYTVTKTETTEYKRKDGQTIKANKVTFSNGKDYMVSNTRFWKIK